MTELKMPKLGQTTTEYKITSWNVAAGDSVDKGDVLCEAESDKAVTEVESYAAGVVKAIHFEVGDYVEVGQVFVTLE